LGFDSRSKRGRRRSTLTVEVFRDLGDADRWLVAQAILTE